AIDVSVEHRYRAPSNLPTLVQLAPLRAVELPRSFAPGPQICPGWFLDAPKLVPKGWAPHDCDHRGRYELSACAGSGQAVCAADTVTGTLQSRRRGVPDATSPDNSITSAHA